MITTYILLRVEHSKPIKDITDHAANRVSTMSNVEGISVYQLTEELAKEVIGNPPKDANNGA